RRRGRLKILTARVSDETGEIKATWFNQPWLERRLQPGTRVRLRGRANRYGFAVSTYDLDGEVETAAFAPVYPAREDLAQKKLRELRGQVIGTVRDVGEPLPVRRLLQGDVGSGKTVVALYALLRAVEAGRQGALMAPTETLAEQHFLTIEDLCGGLGIRVSLLTSSLRAREHAAVRQLVASGDAQLVVGTHALIQKEVDFNDLAVAVVDEQHRFGVGQRSALVEGRSPHVLHMTATPIPRTLALTVYGGLRVSEIAEPPASRKPVVTAWVTAERSSEAYTRLRKHLDAGRQAYVVCPLIEEGETTLARAAEQEAERLRVSELAGLRVGCLHGRL